MIYHISDFLKSYDTSYALSEAVSRLCDGDTLCLEGKELEINNTFAEGETFYLPRYSNLKKYYAVSLKGKRNITIDGEGASLIFDGDISGFGLSDCDGVTLKNFTMDYKTPCFIQGRVIQSSDDSIVLDFKTEGQDVKYDADEKKLLFRPIGSANYLEADSFLVSEVDPETRFRRTGSPDYFLCINKVHPVYPSISAVAKAVEVADGRIKFTFKDRKITHKPGNCIVGAVHERRNNNIHLFKCKNVTLENITMYTSLSFGVINLCGENMAVRNVNSTIKPNSGRLLAVVADMFHCVNMRGNVDIRECVVESLLDDCVNVHSLLSIVKRAVGSDTLLVHFTYLAKKAINLYSPDERVAVLHPETFEKIKTLTVRSSEYVGDYHLKIQFREDIADIPQGYILESEDAKPSLSISDCRMGKNRGRGLLVHCGRKTVIENNVLYSSSCKVVASGASRAYLEGSAVTDLTIKNNDLSEGYCGCPAIHINPSGISELRAPYHRGIKIFGNKFGADTTRAVYLRGCADVEIYDNILGDESSVDLISRGLVAIEMCEDVKSK